MVRVGLVEPGKILREEEEERIGGADVWGARSHAGASAICDITSLSAREHVLKELPVSTSQHHLVKD